MSKKAKELLPIGSVILVKDANKRMMIIGIKLKTENKEYDYMGVLYPEGFIDNKHTYLFNHEDIVNVSFLGYMDVDQQILRNKIDELEDK